MFGSKARQPDPELAEQYKRLNAIAERIGASVRFAPNESVLGFHVKIAELNCDHMAWVEQRLLGKSPWRN